MWRPLLEEKAACLGDFNELQAGEQLAVQGDYGTDGFGDSEPS